MQNLKTYRINVMISNMERAIEFYHRLLGFELANRYGDHYAELQAPDLLIGLRPASEKAVYGTNMSIGLGVTDFDATIRIMESKVLSFVIETVGWIRLAFFKDPDNNCLFLTE